MGLAINQQQFSQADHDKFSKKLNSNLTTLDKLLKDPDFGNIGKDRKIGSEIELYLIDKHGAPAHFNTEIKDLLNDDQLTLELNRYNLEYNLKPVQLNQNPITAMGNEITHALSKINQAAKTFSCSALPIGILPTTSEADFGYHVVTPQPRYQALVKELRKVRGGPFKIQIQGRDHLQLEMEDVTLEGANTSLQLHYQVNPSEFAETYNALQFITPLIVAAGANSPFVFGHRLWHETRIPLFKQSIDCRRYDPLHPQPARVNFGHGWVRDSAIEIFSEAVRLYRPLLPVCEDSNTQYGHAPPLDELRLQQGSVWLWNRPVYDPADNGHLRIEARTLPAGPSIKDMSANIVLLLGLMELWRPKLKSLLPCIPFEYCERNFYRAAELGLQAELIWPNHKQSEPEYQSCKEILLSQLPQLPDALDNLGIAASEYSSSLDILEHRINNEQTGAAWQLNTYNRLSNSLSKEDALKRMLHHYQLNSEQDKPVSQWSLP